ncbi:MAG: amino acid permease, partial [Gemmatimonadota bacterium]
IGGILSTMSALNATTFSSTRVSFAMGRDRNLPDFFGKVHGGTRTPYLALLASGALIIFMAVSMPIQDVAAAADVMFLLLFLQVNIAIITIRRRYGDKLDYGFLIPFFPVLPIIAIVLMLGIAIFMFHFSPLAWYFVAGWIGAGFVIYYAWARKREREKKVTPVVLRHRLERPERYRVLVPVANPQSARALIDFAAVVARQRDGEVVLLHVITVPEQTPLRVGRGYVREARDEIVDVAEEMAAEHDVASSSIIRIAHTPAQAIIHEIEDGHIDLAVLGWQGPRRAARTAIGSNIDMVMRNAHCDVAVLRADDLPSGMRVLIPVSFPEQARLMLEYGGMLEQERGARLDLLHVVPQRLGEAEREARVRELTEGLDLESGPRELRVETSRDIVGGIVKAAADHDLTILGAAREGWVRKIVAGSRPEQMARRISGRLLLVKQGRNPIRSRVLDTIDFFRMGATPGSSPGAASGSSSGSSRGSSSGAGEATS